jgi:hypothetical protein
VRGKENNMSPLENPVRLRTLLGRHSALGRGIEAAQASGPTDEQLKALECLVLAGVAASAATAVVTAAAQVARPAAGLSWATAKLVLCLAVGTSIGAGGALWWQNERGSHSAPAESARKLADQTVHAPVLPSSEPMPSKPTPALLSGPAPADHPVVAASNAAKSKVRTLSRDLATDAEVPLLEQAHRALSESSVLALKLAREHKRRFPSSTLDQERELIEVTALVDLGRMDEARRLAHRYSEQHPGSAYVGRINRIVRQPSER